MKKGRVIHEGIHVFSSQTILDREGGTGFIQALCEIRRRKRPSSKLNMGDLSLLPVDGTICDADRGFGNYDFPSETMP